MLVRWGKRCGKACAEKWNETVGKIVGLHDPARQALSRQRPDAGHPGVRFSSDRDCTGMDRILRFATLTSRMGAWFGGALVVLAAVVISVDVAIRKLLG